MATSIDGTSPTDEQGSPTSDTNGPPLRRGSRRVNVSFGHGLVTAALPTCRR